jgi:hypothetical protein
VPFDAIGGSLLQSGEDDVWIRSLLLEKGGSGWSAARDALLH